MHFNLFVAAAALAVSSFSSVANAEKRPADGCGSVNGETDCVAYVGCKWFLGACTEKPLVNCWDHAKSRKRCNKTPGCKWFSDPVEYVPSGSDQYVNELQCRDHTVCDVFVKPSDCNRKSWCAWVDGKCRTYGTQPSDDWNPKCWNAGTYRQTCKFQSPKCKWFSINVGEDNVVYGCRHVEFCDMDKGDDQEKQCSSSKYCVWKGGKCQRNPTQSPTTSPSPAPSMSPTATPTVPTKSPTIAPTTKSPTNKPTTRTPTLKPTTAYPTVKPTTAYPSV